MNTLAKAFEESGVYDVLSQTPPLFQARLPHVFAPPHRHVTYV